MIISAHQPHYLPWTGYINRLLLADKFVIMDNMYFTSYNYINRNRIIQAGKPLKLSLPIKNKAKSNQLIKDIELDYSHTFRGIEKHLKSINYNYSNTIGFAEFFPSLEKILKHNYKWLIDIDLDLICLIKDYLKIDTEIILGSEQNIKGKKEDELFLSLLEKTGGKKILLGLGASTKYINSNVIEESGGEIIYQNFNHPLYKQTTKKFIPGVSVIDLLFNVSRNEAIDLIKKSGKIEEKN